MRLSFWLSPTCPRMIQYQKSEPTIRHDDDGGPTMPSLYMPKIVTYTLAFVPCLIWLFDSLNWGVIGVAALIAIPHLIQDDGRLLTEYARVVKKADLNANPSLGAVLDQAFHFVALFLVALLAGK